MEDSWPQPPPFTWASVSPREPLPIFPPPESLSPPPLPSPARRPAFDAPYTLSTHIFPAAYLRTTEYVRPPPSPPTGGTKAERQAYANTVARKLKDLRGSLSPRGTKQVLWNCANRYVKIGLDEKQASGVTLFFAHANGFPKESTGPTMHAISLTSSISTSHAKLLPRLFQPISSVFQRENQHTVSIIRFAIEHWLPLATRTGVVPYPVIIKPAGSLIHESEHSDNLVRCALTRRQTWSSSTWDPAVLKVYIECGTYDTTDPITGETVIRLKMPGMQEAIIFSETHTGLEVFQRLPTLDERIELRWIVPGKPSAGG
ncbi:hypothetical protein C0989_007351 [Termitomyces sp. Mn162]|nr:hypothetical protein C0989_007351 [Termitomyces sp. Mn162]